MTEQNLHQTLLQQETQQEIQQQIQREILEPTDMPSYAKKSFNLWRSSVSKKIKEPKYDINPNELYYRISEEDRETYYEPEGTCGAPLLKRSERRMRAILRKQATRIRLSLNLNRDSST